MDKNSILYQLMDARMNGIINEITNSDKEYQEISQNSDEYSSRLDTLHLPEEVRILIDRYVSEQNALGARYGMLAYLLGFSDCVELLFGSLPFSDVKEMVRRNEH